MLFRRIYHPRLAQASYLVACARTREAIAIDPTRDVGQYLAAARAEGVRIVAVTETHVHADFISGASELAAAADARLYLSGEGQGPGSYTPEYLERSGAVLLRDGDTIAVGAVRIQVLHTPGHTPEHITFLVTDTAAADEPMGAVTGDFVFVGDVGRPDLLERALQIAGSSDRAARQLFASLGRLAAYPDYLQLWPGHGAGSACGKGLSAVPQSTLGYERRHNWAFGVRDEDAFVAQVQAGQPEPPAYFAATKRINRQGGATTPAPPPPASMDADAVRRAAAAGTLVIDIRPASDFAAGHLPGTISIPYERSFLAWAGSIVPDGSDAILVGTAPALDDAVADLRLIGIDRIVGTASSAALEAWRRAGGRLRTLTSITADELAARVRQGSVTVVDVRERAEWAAGHIAGAVHVPLGLVRDRAGDLPRDRPLVVHCQSGARSTIAGSILLAAGVDAVENLAGGLAAWQGAGHATDTGTSSAA